MVQLPLFNTAFTTTPLSAGQLLVCVAVSSGVLWVSELRKLILRPGPPPGRYPVGVISRVIGVIPPTAAAA